MSQAPTVNRQWPRKRTAAPERKSKRRYVIWVLGSLSILLLSGLGIAWATGYFDPNPRIAEINQLVGQMQDGNRKDRRESFEKMRKDMEGLSDAEKKAVWEKMRQMRMEKEKERLAAFFKMSADEQKAEIQKEIERRLRRQKEMEERMAQAAANPDQSNGGSSSAQNGSGNNQGPGGRGAWRSMTEEQRINAQKQRLDNTTPEFRAQAHLYNQMVQQQAAAQGLPLRWNGGMAGLR